MAMSTRDEVTSIVREHSDFVWRTLRFWGVRDRDLEDATQEVFIVVCRKLDTFEGRSSMRTWLAGICKRTAAAHRRKAHVRRELPVETVAEPEDKAPQETPEGELQQHQELTLLQRALDSLDDDKREVFVLYEIEQMSMPEVAKALGCKLQTAYSRYHVAKERVIAFVKRESHGR